jgi:hypothetical protein
VGNLGFFKALAFTEVFAIKNNYGVTLQCLVFFLQFPATFSKRSKEKNGLIKAILPF